MFAQVHGIIISIIIIIIHLVHSLHFALAIAYFHFGRLFFNLLIILCVVDSFRHWLPYS